MTSDPDINNPKALLRGLFDHAVDAVQPETCVATHLPRTYHTGRFIVVGAGKAAAAMARAVEDYTPDRVSGQIITAHGHGVECKRIKVIEAGHPLPEGKAGRAAARRCWRCRRPASPLTTSAR